MKSIIQAGKENERTRRQTIGDLMDDEPLVREDLSKVINSKIARVVISNDQYVKFYDGRGKMIFQARQDWIFDFCGNWFDISKLERVP